MSVPTVPPASGPPTGPDPDLLVALSPSTPPWEQRRIAAERPDLHAALAANPGIYPELLGWLRGSEDPAVQAALAQRGAPHAVGAPAPRVPGVHAPPAAAPQVPAAAAPTATPGGPAARGRRRAPWVVGAVVVVVLAVAGAGFGLRALLDRAGSSSPAASTVEDVSTSWTEGSHRTWTLDVGESVDIAVNGDQMVVGTRDSSDTLTRVSAYDISGAEPDKQWETEVDQEYGHLSYWGEWIAVGGNRLLRASDGAPTTAGWDEDAAPVLIAAYALTCDRHDRCTGWSASDPTTSLWVRRIENPARYVQAAYYNWAVHDDTPVTLITQGTAVRLEDGALIDLAVNSSTEYVLPLADGWLVTDVASDGFRVLSPSGEQVDSFKGAWPDTDQEVHVNTFGSPRPTAAQMRALLVDGDRSWASMTSLRSPSATGGCPITLTIGEHTLVPVGRDGGCVDRNGNSWYGLSSDAALLMRVEGSPLQTGSSVRLGGMWSVADGSPVPFAGSGAGEQLMWLAGPELVVAFDVEHGQLTAYAPGKG